MTCKCSCGIVWEVYGSLLSHKGDVMAKSGAVEASVDELEKRIATRLELCEKAKKQRSDLDKAAREYMKEVEQLRSDLIVALKAR